MKILLVEDDTSLAATIGEALKAHRYVIDVASDGQMGWDLLELFSYDVILLDLLLPKLDGLSFCRQVRDRGDRTPILLLTGQETNDSKVMGLDAGADDYLVKPVNLGELLARIRALLRRGRESLTPTLSWGALQLNPNSCQVTYEDRPVKLTAKEYEILELLLRNPQRIYNQHALIDCLWPIDESPSGSAVRTHIKGLRHKLKKAGAGDAIETIYGLGYRLREASSSTFPSNPSNPEEGDRQEIPATVLPYLTIAWELHKTKYLDRLVKVEKAIAALIQGELNEELHHSALQELHILAGSLGSFGLMEASKQSRHLEKYLRDSSLAAQKGRELQNWVGKLRQEIEGTGENPSPEALTEQEANTAEIAPYCAYPTLQKLLIVDDDIGLTDILAQEAKNWGLVTQTANSLEAARNAIASQIPDILLLDLNFPDSELAGFILLSQLKIKHPALPVVILTASETLTNRVKASRLGGWCFLAKPIAPSLALQIVCQTLKQSQPHSLRVLMVDDDSDLLQWLQQCLKTHNIEAIALNDPKQFWPALRQFQPDLLLLDLKMPQLSGIDLCQIVRSDPNWQHLPIIMLSAQSDRAIAQTAYQAGVNDYLQKPIAETQLINCISYQIEHGNNSR
ncbi:response regulator [Spirulina sp. 06S082]|uniref:response regulator n=1 Tax=Spirulina sp. 06S082 TaxID=3110248 RepID=UPI002B1F0F93|nr:response regulator [Spirulina sp. 06S082]MEA5467747.1 response regulator [Spirulina sp. 06S082]